MTHDIIANITLHIRLTDEEHAAWVDSLGITKLINDLYVKILERGIYDATVLDWDWSYE